MAFGGTVNRESRFDTRRYRRIDPQGSHPLEQAKLLGGRNPCTTGLYGSAKKRELLVRKVLLKEMQNPDITPAPRCMTDRIVRLYLIGRTIIVSEIFGDETLGHYDEFREWQ